jgi:hypothetical protein
MAGEREALQARRKREAHILHYTGGRTPARQLRNSARRVFSAPP